MRFLCKRSCKVRFQAHPNLQALCNRYIYTCIHINYVCSDVHVRSCTLRNLHRSRVYFTQHVIANEFLFLVFLDLESNYVQVPCLIVSNEIMIKQAQKKAKRYTLLSLLVFFCEIGKLAPIFQVIPLTFREYIALKDFGVMLMQTNFSTTYCVLSNCMYMYVRYYTTKQHLSRRF